jgi:hypothetical protein
MTHGKERGKHLTFSHEEYLSHILEPIGHWLDEAINDPQYKPALVEGGSECRQAAHGRLPGVGAHERRSDPAPSQQLLPPLLPCLPALSSGEP